MPRYLHRLHRRKRGHFRNEYICMPKRSFTRVNDQPPLFNDVRPHYTKVVRLELGPVIFPLKKAYEAARKKIDMNVYIDNNEDDSSSADSFTVTTEAKEKNQLLLRSLMTGQEMKPMTPSFATWEDNGLLVKRYRRATMSSPWTRLQKSGSGRAQQDLQISTTHPGSHSARRRRTE